MNCTWLIDSPPNQKFSRVNFHAPVIESEKGSDYLKIFDGPGPNFPVLQTFSGEPKHNTDPFVSSGRKLFVLFKSDGSRSGGSFSFSFATDRCLPDTEYNAPTSLLTDGSPDFGRYRNGTCRYIVKPTTAVDQIALYFEQFDLSINDTVTITENNQDSKFSTKFYGKGPFPPIYARHEFSVEFASKVDSSRTSTQPNGFALRYTAGYCLPNVAILDDLATISDGSGSKNYKDSTYCEWLIQPKSGKDMITFFAQHLSTAETADVITIYDGPTTASPKIGTLHGKLPMNPVYSSGNQMLVTWKTDGSNNAEGWSASVLAGSCTGRLQFTTQIASFTDGSGSQNISSDNCEWAISPAKADQMVTVYIGNVSIASGAILVSSGSQVLQTITQSEDPFVNYAIPPVYVTGSAALVTMKGATGGQGFSAQYASGRCLPFVLFTWREGELNDGSGPANYLDYTRCAWLIRPPSNTTGIEITFVGDTAETGDKITVHDGFNDKFPILGTLSGNFASKTFRSSSEMLYVTWVADSSKNSAGWTAKYSIF